MNNYEGYWEGLLRKHNEEMKDENVDIQRSERRLDHSDIYLVRDALEKAKEYGLETEVMYSALTMAAEANEHGLSMEQVLEAALKEWDI